MPEVVTRYPEVLIQELKDANGKCGEGAPQQILKKCPHDHFCALPTGEICVYDLDDILTMTQISSSDWRAAVTGIPSMFGLSNILVLLFIFGLGLVVGAMLSKK